MLSSPGNSTAEAALGLLVERDRLLLLLFSALLGLWLMSSIALHGNTKRDRQILDGRLCADDILFYTQVIKPFEQNVGDSTELY